MLTVILLGIVTFILMFLTKYLFKKIPILSISFESLVLTTLLNYSLSIFTGNHHKLCYAIKAWAVALALYAIYEQFFIDTSKAQ